MIKRKPILSLFLAIPVFLGCLLAVVGYLLIRDKQKNEERLIDEGVPLDYAYRWLEGVPCSPPCWEGVTPGVTTADEAIEILNDNSAIASGSASLFEFLGVGFVTWDWVGTDMGGDAMYDMQDPNKTIASIRPEFDYLDGLEHTFILEDVISKLGDPSYITVYVGYGIEGQGPFFIVEMHFTEEGISLAQGKINRRMPMISPKLKFNLVQFHALPYTPSIASAVWTGYKSFSEYCKEMPNDVVNDECVLVR